MQGNLQEFQFLVVWDILHGNSWGLHMPHPLANPLQRCYSKGLSDLASVCRLGWQRGGFGTGWGKPKTAQS